MTARDAERGRVVRAFALAPLTAPLAYALGLVAAAVIPAFGRAPWPSLASLGGILLAVAGVGIPTAYAAMLLAGLPCYLLLRRLAAVRRAPLWIAGGATGVAVALMLAPSLRGDLFSVPFPWWAGAALGLLSAEAFWRLLPKRAAMPAAPPSHRAAT